MHRLPQPSLREHPAKSNDIPPSVSHPRALPVTDDSRGCAARPTPSSRPCASLPRPRPSAQAPAPAHHHCFEGPRWPPPPAAPAPSPCARNMRPAKGAIDLRAAEEGPSPQAPASVSGAAFPTTWRSRARPLPTLPPPLSPHDCTINKTPW